MHLALEYVEGGELLKLLQSKGAYSECDSRKAIIYILEAIDYCHSRGIIHRDLKLENIILKYHVFNV